jgi:hypothetical protein
MLRPYRPNIMNNTKVGHFPPQKRFGLILHGTIILVLGGVSAWGVLNLTRAQVGPEFVIDLLLALLAFAPIPLLAYRAYALLRSDYYIDRDSLAILWGLRIEDIPLTDIEWVRPATDLTHPLAGCLAPEGIVIWGWLNSSPQTQRTSSSLPLQNVSSPFLQKMQRGLSAPLRAPPN